MKCRGWAWVALALSTTAMAGEVKVTVSGKGGLSGSGTVVTKLDDKGGRLQRTRILLKSESGPSMSIFDESLCSSTGRPVRSLMKFSQGTKTLQSIGIEFGKNGAVIKVNNSGEAKTITRKLPSGKLEAPSDLWFVKTKPKSGATDEYYRIDSSTLEWEKIKVTYQGPQKVQIGGGKTVTGHLITHPKSKIWLDDKGDPLRIESASGITVVRA